MSESQIINNELAQTNKLSFNESKLLIVRPTSKLRTTLLNIKLNDYLLTPEKSAKYLDINIDKTFLEQTN